MKRIKRLFDRRKARQEQKGYVTAGSDGFAWQGTVECGCPCDHAYCLMLRYTRDGAMAVTVPVGGGAYRHHFWLTPEQSVLAGHDSAPVRAGFAFALTVAATVAAERAQD